MSDGREMRLRATKLVETLGQLKARIAERFPDSGLAKLCAVMEDTAKATTERVDDVSRPNMPLRAAVFLVVLVVAAAAALVASSLAPGVIDFLIGDGAARDPAAVAQALESAVNLMIFAAVAIWFLVQLEARLKRRQALAHLHELRSYAHVVDMHQLTKDPVAIVNPAARTPSSPKRDMSEFELARYLDYCSEMLALIGKLAALYGERTADAEVVGAANDIETLSTNLGRKIWQKIMIISGGGPLVDPKS